MIFLLIILPICCHSHLQKHKGSAVSAILSACFNTSNIIFLFPSNPKKFKTPKCSVQGKSALPKPPTGFFEISFNLFTPIYYTKKELPQIFKMFLGFQALVLGPIFDKSQKRLPKARATDIYCDIFYLKYYNFFQKGKNYFATAGATIKNKIFLQPLFWKTGLYTTSSNISKSSQAKL